MGLIKKQIRISKAYKKSADIKNSFNMENIDEEQIKKKLFIKEFRYVLKVKEN